MDKGVFVLSSIFLFLIDFLFEIEIFKSFGYLIDLMLLIFFDDILMEMKIFINIEIKFSLEFFFLMLILVFLDLRIDFYV